MTPETVIAALRDLGREKWIRPTLGLQPTNQPMLFGHPFDIESLNYSHGEWTWPEDVKVGFELEWLPYVETPRLDAIDASIAQPINLIGLYDGSAVVGIAGLIVSPGWREPEVDVFDLDDTFVMGIPDGMDRVSTWECLSLARALEITSSLVPSDANEVIKLLGLRTK